MKLCRRFFQIALLCMPLAIPAIIALMAVLVVKKANISKRPGRGSLQT